MRRRVQREPGAASALKCERGIKYSLASVMGLKSIALHYRRTSGLMCGIEQGRCIGAEYDAGSCLLIIGNGFDLHHDLSTGYSDYHDWLVDHDGQVATDFETFGFALECSDFEGSLGCIRGSVKGVDPRGTLLKNRSVLNEAIFVMRF